MAGDRGGDRAEDSRGNLKDFPNLQNIEGLILGRCYFSGVEAASTGFLRWLLVFRPSCLSTAVGACAAS